MCSLLKSYRVITPPSDATVAPWLKTIIDLDPKSDNSELNDLLVSSFLLIYYLLSVWPIETNTTFFYFPIFKY